MKSATALSIAALSLLFPGACSPLQGSGDGGGGSGEASGGATVTTGGQSSVPDPSGGTRSCGPGAFCFPPGEESEECDVYVYQVDDLSDVELGGAGGVTVCLVPIFK